MGAASAPQHLVSGLGQESVSLTGPYRRSRVRLEQRESRCRWRRSRRGSGSAGTSPPPGSTPTTRSTGSAETPASPNYQDGGVAFEQPDVEVPATWSLNATNILAQKYFRGTLGTPERETSLRQVIDRVVDTITAWGIQGGYFVDDSEAEAFRDELKHLIVHQKAAFNSPVWFNIGVKGVPQQASACFILAVDDTMDSILNWYVEEGTIFKGGSGSGINLSKIRSSKELLKGGGTASGPVSFMRGADASAGTIKSGGKTRRAAKMVILNADHPDIEEFIWCKAIEERKARVLRDAGLRHGSRRQRQPLDPVPEREQLGAGHRRLHAGRRSTTATGTSRAVTTGEVHQDDEGARPDASDRPQRRGSAPTRACSSTRRSTAGTPRRTRAASIASNPCSEYMHLDNSACNLASINLLTFLGDDDEFDVEGYKATIEVMFTAQEILVGNADYPTEKIARDSRRFRQLGLGYANLGALLMALGMPYDSDAGRAWAGAITALMTGHAYATSARTAARMGPFAGYAENAEPMLHVLRMHRAEAAKIDEELVPPQLLGAAQAVVGRRASSSASSTACATRRRPCSRRPARSALMMDCDTTGIEPDLALMKAKKLVGGGTMLIVNQTIPRALRTPRLHDSPDRQDRRLHRRAQDDHRCTPRQGRAPAGVRVLDGRQHHPLHGPRADDGGRAAVHQRRDLQDREHARRRRRSKTSRTCTSSRGGSGLKAVAIYRDNCKVAQPLSTPKKESDAISRVRTLRRRAPTTVVERIVETDHLQEPVRQKLPRTRQSKTFSFRVADCHGYVTVGEYDDGRPGEMFLQVAKQGSTLAGIMDAFAISVSHGLQYGVPLEAFVEMFTNMRFEPAGMTDDPDIRFASSPRSTTSSAGSRVEYLTYDKRDELGIMTVGERLQPTLPGVEETVVETTQGYDMVSDPKTIPSANELATQIELGPRSRGPDDRADPDHPLGAAARGCADDPGERCPDLHAMRCPDEPSGQLLRLPELRQHERLQLISLM